MGWRSELRRALAEGRTSLHLDPIQTKVVGVSFRNPGWFGAERQYLIASLEEEDFLALKRERANPYDPNAVKVLDPRGRQIGYLSKGVARNVAAALDMGIKVVAQVQEITGGLPGARTLGVNIILGGLE